MPNVKISIGLCSYNFHPFSTRMNTGLSFFWFGDVANLKMYDTLMITYLSYAVTSIKLHVCWFMSGRMSSRELRLMGILLAFSFETFLPSSLAYST